MSFKKTALSCQLINVGAFDKLISIDSQFGPQIVNCDKKDIRRWSLWGFCFGFTGKSQKDK
jgi:hypothetical protein